MNKKTENAQITIIVCTYNRSAMLSDTLKSLINQETNERLNYEILVVDDRSTDDTRDVVLGLSSTSSIPIRYIKGGGKGIAAARNVGLKNVETEWLIYFDDDQIAEPDWLINMLDCAQSENALCVGGKRLIKLIDTQIDLSLTDRLLLGEIDHGNEIRKCKRKEFPAAGNILLLTDIFASVGFFDESLVRGGEDIELASRLRDSNIDSWYTPHAIVHHITPAYRTEPSYLYWASLRAGENFAHRDYLEWGMMKTVFACLARIGQSLLVHFPKYLFAYVTGNGKLRSEYKYRLLRTYAYITRTLNLLSPNLFPMERFLGKLEFRKERKIFLKAKTE
ncbi:glycosyltransferase family 2 protein [candidate division KSB1 bacterium]|nr:glycosyltransferase family 2 protein [candidate division KSB1 bacterium]